MRLPTYDYSWAGSYFVTICVDDRTPRFGKTVDQCLHLNDAGKMIDQHWLSLPERFSHIALDEYIIMPNHLHAILRIDSEKPSHAEPLGSVVGAFKSLTTRNYASGVRSGLWQPFDGRLWQHSFYDHVVRDERDLERIRDYIAANPARWLEDREYRA